MGHILVIDDDDAILNSIYKVLTHLGYQVDLAHDGEEGLKLLENRYSFELVITDIRMPKVDGNAVARYIRNSSKSEDIPIVAITGSGDDVNKDLFDSLLVKPFKMKDLISLIKSFPC